MAAALHDLSFKFKGFVEHFILPQHVDKVKERALRRLLMFTVSTFADGVSWVIHRSLKRDSWLVIGFTEILGNEPFSTFIGSSALTVSVFTLNGVNEWRDLILKKVELAQAVEILVTADEFQLFLEYLHLSTHTFPKDGKDYINNAAQTFCETDNTQLQLVTSYLSHSLFFTVFFAFPDSTTNSQPPVHPETTLPPDIHQLKASLPSPSCPLLLCQLPSCVKIATLVCGACKSALYCCEDHRQLDWSSNEGQHAVKCVPLVAFDPLTQPIPGTTGAGSAPPEDYWNPDLASICLDVKEMQIISWNCSENKLFLVKVQYALFVEGNTAPVITVYNKDSTVKVNLKPTTPGYAELTRSYSRDLFTKNAKVLFRARKHGDYLRLYHEAHILGRDW